MYECENLGRHSLSSGLQLTDLEPDQQVILADTLTQVGLGDGVQLGGWNWHTETQKLNVSKLGFV